MRKSLIALLVTFASALPAAAGNFSVSIGIDVPAYPTLQRIPHYPVYYAPNLRTNYFFYDGLYWVFDGGDWYSSTWYNGPWLEVGRYEVPAALLHVPVRYYRSKPVSFRTYRVDAAPHWHHHWGPAWAERRTDWERWDVRRAPAPAPLPAYQRRYAREHYPVVEQQYVIRSRHYQYEPRDPVVREVYRERRFNADASYREPRFNAETYREPRFNADTYREPRFNEGTYRERRFTADTFREPRLNVDTYRERRAHAESSREPVYSNTYREPTARQREAGGPPAHAPAHGYRAKEERKREKEEWKRVHEERKDERKAERERDKEDRKEAKERAKDERHGRYERVAQRRGHED